MLRRGLRHRLSSSFPRGLRINLWRQHRSSLWRCYRSGRGCLRRQGLGCRGLRCDLGLRGLRCNGRGPSFQPWGGRARGQNFRPLGRYLGNRRKEKRRRNVNVTPESRVRRKREQTKRTGPMKVSRAGTGLATSEERAAVGSRARFGVQPLPTERRPNSLPC